jgi:hypothetical protein
MSILKAILVIAVAIGRDYWDPGRRDTRVHAQPHVTYFDYDVFTTLSFIKTTKLYTRTHLNAPLYPITEEELISSHLLG